jgi:hypothetical protein
MKCNLYSTFRETNHAMLFNRQCARTKDLDSTYVGWSHTFMYHQG